MTSGVFQAATPSSQPPHRGNISVNVAPPATWCQPTVQAGSSTTPLSMPYKTTEGADQSQVDTYLRVLNHANKKDFHLFTLHNLSREMDSSEKLKMAIFTQCGDESVPLRRNMEFGFYNQSGKKLWINNRLDVNDMWELVSKGDKLTLWCVGIGKNPQSSRNTKRSSNERDKEGASGSEPPKKMSRVEEKRALAEENEKKLKENMLINFRTFSTNSGRKCWHMISTKALRIHQVMQCSDVRVKVLRRDKMVQQMAMLLLVHYEHIVQCNHSGSELARGERHNLVPNEEGGVAKHLHKTTE